MVILLRNAASAFLAVLAAQGPARHAGHAEMAFVEHALLEELVEDGLLGGAG
jgi:hypothetical protein